MPGGLLVNLPAMRLVGVEPASSAWWAGVLPLHHSRVCARNLFQLPVGFVFSNGRDGTGGIRTPIRLLAKQVPFQLGHSPESVLRELNPHQRVYSPLCYRYTKARLISTLLALKRMLSFLDVLRRRGIKRCGAFHPARQFSPEGVRGLLRSQNNLRSGNIKRWGAARMRARAGSSYAVPPKGSPSRGRPPPSSGPRPYTPLLAGRRCVVSGMVAGHILQRDTSNLQNGRVRVSGVV